MESLSVFLECSCQLYRLPKKIFHLAVILTQFKSTYACITNYISLLCNSSFDLLVFNMHLATFIKSLLLANAGLEVYADTDFQSSILHCKNNAKSLHEKFIETLADVLNKNYAEYIWNLH